MQDLNDKVTGNSLTASEWNEVPSEIQNVIEAAGITLSGADLDQLGKAIAGYVSFGNFAIDSGTADNYVLSALPGIQAPQSLYDGMEIKFVPINANTSAGTSVSVNPFGLGATDIVKEDGSVFRADTEFKVGAMARIRYDDSASNFKLLRIQNADAVDYGIGRIATNGEVNAGSETSAWVTPQGLNQKTANETRRGVAEVATQTETNTGTDDGRIVTPLKLETRLGLLGSDDIDNDSSVSGATISDALESLDSEITSLESNDNVYVRVLSSDLESNLNQDQKNLHVFNSLVNGLYMYEGYFLVNESEWNSLGLSFVFSRSGGGVINDLTFIYELSGSMAFEESTTGIQTFTSGSTYGKWIKITGWFEITSNQTITITFAKDDATTGTIHMLAGTSSKVSRVN